MELLTWIEGHPELSAGLVALSVATFVGSLISLPWLVARLPEDYFAHHHREHDYRGDPKPKLHLAVVAVKNVIGVVLVVAGIAMLVLPGQGLLTILIGLMLTDFPGKYQLERWLATRSRVMRALNWMRARSGRPPLVDPRHLPSPD